MGEPTSRFAKRIEPLTPGARPRPGGTRIPGLRLLPVVFLPGMLTALVSGRPVALLALLAGMALVVLAGVLVRRGLDATAGYDARAIARAPAPYRLAGALALGLAFLLTSWFATGYGPVMGVVFAALGIVAAIVTYGLDPRAGKGLGERTGGVAGERVLAAIEEAEAKLAAIEGSASGLENRELRAHLARIVAQARAALAEIERDPKDLGRARRFLNTYLDGTRDVVRDYARRQDDFADTPLADNFKNVLATIEQVFTEQVAHLRKDEELDLDVAIEVLRTQLTKEGVG